MNWDTAMLLVRKAALAVIFVLAVLYMPAPGCASDITTLSFRQINKDIVVNASLQLDEKMIDDLNSGLSKEIVFNVELFRYRKIWPNEFIAGKTIVRLLQSNPIKREYIGTSIDGKVKTVKRFKDISSMIAWGANVEELTLANISMEEDGDYFVKVSAEARMLTMPAVVGYILFFLPTKEFGVSKDSTLFGPGPPGVNK
jgi:hypothetical protein